MAPEPKHRLHSESHDTFQRLCSIYFKSKPTTNCGALKQPKTFRTQRHVWEYLIPTVHAKEAVDRSVIEERTQSEDDKSAMTSMERLQDSRPKALVTDAEIQAYIARETGRERLNIMFTKMNDGQFHPNLAVVGTSAFYCSGIIFLIMTYYSSREAQEEFIVHNKATKFETKFLANRSYHDAVIKASLKVGFRYAIKAGVYTGLFLNKTSVVEYMAAGGVAGMLFRTSGGLRAMLASGIISSVLGGVAGSLVWLSMYLGDETQEKRHYWYTESILKEKKEARILAGKEDMPMT